MMTVHDHEKLLTADNLLAMPEGDVKRELVRGELIELAPTGRSHGKLSANAFRLIDRNSNAWELGELTIEGPGYILFRNPDTVRAPDVAFTLNERLAGTDDDGYYMVAPDLAIEIMSPNDSGEDIQMKIGDYLRAGTELVVVIYPKTRELLVRSTTSTLTLGINDTFDLSAVIPGLTLPVRDIFAPLDRKPT